MRLFLNDLGVFEHRDAATLGRFALNSYVLTTVFSELIVDWLVFANHQICFPLAYDAGRPARNPAGDCLQRDDVLRLGQQRERRRRRLTGR